MCHFQAKVVNGPSSDLLALLQGIGGMVTDERASVSLGLFLSDRMEHSTLVTQVQLITLMRIIFLLVFVA